MIHLQSQPQPQPQLQLQPLIRNVKQTDIDSDEFCCLDDDTNEQQQQELRQELIQRATTRLRRRLLEQGLQDVMSQVVSLQTQLESLRLDASTTIDTISNIFLLNNETTTSTIKMNRQMDVLERRLESHKSSLYQFISSEETVIHHSKPTTTASTTTVTDEKPLAALSMSRLSSISLMSSIFGRNNSSNSSSCSSTSSTSSSSSGTSRATSISSSMLQNDDCISHIEHIQGCQEQDDPFYDLAGKRSFRAGSFCGSVYHDHQQQQPIIAPNHYHGNNNDIRYRRRQRRQRHQQQLEQQQGYNKEDEESVMCDDSSSISSLSNRHHHPLSPMTPPTRINQFFFQQDHQDLTQSWLSSVPIVELLEKKYSDTKVQQVHVQQLQQRNVLDDAMSFLDGLSENGDDGGFGEDMYFLLGNPDLCCRPLSEIQSTMQELRQQQQQQQQPQPHHPLYFINPTTLCQMGIQFSTNMIYKATCSSLQWCRFLSILAAAVIISLLKGPEDIRRYSTTSL